MMAAMAIGDGGDWVLKAAAAHPLQLHPTIPSIGSVHGKGDLAGVRSRAHRDVGLHHQPPGGNGEHVAGNLQFHVEIQMHLP